MYFDIAGIFEGLQDIRIGEDALEYDVLAHGTVQCHRCSDRFLSVRGLKDHIVDTHYNQSKWFLCVDCARAFKINEFCVNRSRGAAICQECRDYSSMESWEPVFN